MRMVRASDGLRVELVSLDRGGGAQQYFRVTLNGYLWHSYDKFGGYYPTVEALAEGGIDLAELEEET